MALGNVQLCLRDVKHWNRLWVDLCISARFDTLIVDSAIAILWPRQARIRAKLCAFWRVFEIEATLLVQQSHFNVPLVWTRRSSSFGFRQHSQVIYILTKKECLVLYSRRKICIITIDVGIPENAQKHFHEPPKKVTSQTGPAHRQGKIKYVIWRSKKTPVISLLKAIYLAQ